LDSRRLFFRQVDAFKIYRNIKKCSGISKLRKIWSLVILSNLQRIAARDIGEGEILSFDTNGDTKDLTTPQKQSSAGETGHFEGRNFDSLFGDADQGRAPYTVAALSIKRTLTNHPLYVIGAVLILASMVGFRIGGMLWPMLGSIAGTGLILLGWERKKHAAQKHQRED
jgi:hypothetical protein